MLPPAHPVSTQVLHFVLDNSPVISTLSSAAKAPNKMRPKAAFRSALVCCNASWPARARSYGAKSSCKSARVAPSAGGARRPSLRLTRSRSIVRSWSSVMKPSFC